VELNINQHLLVAQQLHHYQQIPNPRGGPFGSTGDGTGDNSGLPPPPPPPEPALIISGEFFVEPTISTGGNGKKIKANTKALATWIYDTGQRAADDAIRLKYTPDWSQLALLGADSEVGFGWYDSNNFHMIGLHGNGGSGLTVYKFYGTNFSNLGAGANTRVTGVAPAFGTIDGPNWIRLRISADGNTYSFDTSGDDGATWTTELTGQAPTPFANCVAPLHFGIFVLNEADDLGISSVLISVYAESPTATFSPQFGPAFAR